MDATAHQVPEDAFAAYVLGYTCAHDVTADDWRLLPGHRPVHLCSCFAENARTALWKSSLP
jgi:2-keto-4-pentenoate hydratase/2-oxohepta-3-ene-1,7-dioic acid hydratase in catechol pathway